MTEIAGKGVGALCALIAAAGCGGSSPSPPDAGSDAGQQWSPSSCEMGTFGRGAWQVRCSEGASECDVEADHDVRACVPRDAGSEPAASCVVYIPNAGVETTSLTFDLREGGSFLRVWAVMAPDGSLESCQVGVLEGDRYWVDRTDRGNHCGPVGSDSRCEVGIDDFVTDAPRPGFKGTARCLGLQRSETFGLDVTAPGGGSIEFFVDGCETIPD